MPHITDECMLSLLTAQMIAPETKDATNSKFVGIITKNDEYRGYIYMDAREEAEQIMQKPENEGSQIHVFEYNSTISQKPRDIVIKNRYSASE